MTAADLFAALALAQAAPAPPATPEPLPFPQFMPGEILAAFASAEVALADVSACFGDGSAVAPARLDMLDIRLRQQSARAAGVWGAQQQLAMLGGTASVPQCTGGGAAAMARAEARVATLTTRLNMVLAPLQTRVWLGPMPLCRFGPVKHELLVDRYTAQPSLIMTLHPDAARDLAALTTRQNGFPLALRAGGRIITEPVINEPVTGGQLQISGPSQADLDRLSAALAACPRPAPAATASPTP